MKIKLDAVVRYLKETRAELKKVAWPDQKYIVTATTIILVLCIVMGLYVMGVDYAYAKIFAIILK